MFFDAISLLVIFCAFGMGFLVPRGTTCAVAAVREVIERKAAWRFAGFGMASLAGIAVLVPLSWSHALPLHFAPPMKVTLLVGLGGFIFGLGAAVNGACVFGTLTKIVSGDFSYLFVLPGLWLGSVALGLADLQLSPEVQAGSSFAHFSFVTGAVWAFAAITIMVGFWLFARAGRVDKAVIMSGIGLSGGLLYALHPYWNYSSLVQNSALDFLMSPTRMIDGLLPWLVCAACFGGLLSTGMAGRFKLKAPNVRNSMGALVGGFLMAFGIVMIPGGNDALVLFLLPNLVPAGLLAYAMMNLAIACVVWLEGARVKAKLQGAM
jgi:uncharacterized protein